MFPKNGKKAPQVLFIGSNIIPQDIKNIPHASLRIAFLRCLEHFLMLAHNLFTYYMYMNIIMRSKITLALTTLTVVILVLAALTFMDNNTTRNTYASIILLCCLVIFVIALSLRQPSGKTKRPTYKAG